MKPEFMRVALDVLEDNGNDVEFCLYPGQGHTPSGPVTNEIRRRTEAFLEGHLLAGGEEAAKRFGDRKIIDNQTGH